MQSFPGILAAVLCFVVCTLNSRYAISNPFPYEDQIEPPGFDLQALVAEQINYQRLATSRLQEQASTVLRVHVAWTKEGESYEISAIEKEQSGTTAFERAAVREDLHGSYKAQLIDLDTDQAVYFSALGTGSEYRKILRNLTFRFPLPTKAMRFELYAENPIHGRHEKVLEQLIEPEQVSSSTPQDGLEVRLLSPAKNASKLMVNVYAEGYSASRRNQFWLDAARIEPALRNYGFPSLDHFEIRGIFSPSNKSLGKAQNLGFPIPVRDSFLGLYFPYWTDFGRYYHVVYPTSEEKYRRAIGSVPYDYPIILVDSTEYWGVGNFKELTAVPARNNNFIYLLMHEFGHYFGLNEEYESGGKTELAFAPQINEPWSQNITFHPQRDELKWKFFVRDDTPVPASSNDWGPGAYSAYRGGYAQTPRPGPVYKPGLACTMSSGNKFCAICQAAISERVSFDLGQ